MRHNSEGEEDADVALQHMVILVTARILIKTREIWRHYQNRGGLMALLAWYYSQRLSMHEKKEEKRSALNVVRCFP